MKRVFLKLSGEALSRSEEHTGFDEPYRNRSGKTGEADLQMQESRLGIVIGGGNFWRGQEPPMTIEQYLKQIRSVC